MIPTFSVIHSMENVQFEFINANLQVGAHCGWSRMQETPLVTTVERIAGTIFVSTGVVSIVQSDQLMFCFLGNGTFEIKSLEKKITNGALLFFKPHNVFELKKKQIKAK